MELDDELLTLLVEPGVLVDLEQGFQEVITQSSLPLVVAVLLTVVVVVVLPVLDVVAPN